MVLAFGDIALKNARVTSGGVSRHIERCSMQQAAERGCRFACISPLRDDRPAEARVTWIPITPGTDPTMMLGLVHTLVSKGLHDREFLHSRCDDWAVFEDYLMGRADCVAKHAHWAAAICGMDETVLQALAHSLPGRRVLVVASNLLQRSGRGEQPVWMAAVLGQYGLPGGFNCALGTTSHYGRRNNVV